MIGTLDCCHHCSSTSICTSMLGISMNQHLCLCSIPTCMRLSLSTTMTNEFTVLSCCINNNLDHRRHTTSVNLHPIPPPTSYPPPPPHVPSHAPMLGRSPKQNPPKHTPNFKPRPKWPSQHYPNLPARPVPYYHLPHMCGCECRHGYGPEGSYEVHFHGQEDL